MGPAAKATVTLVYILVLVAAIVGLAIYAGSHLWFASHILMPILAVLFLAAIWFFLYTLAKTFDP